MGQRNWMYALGHTAGVEEGYQRGLTEGRREGAGRRQVLGVWAADELRMLPGVFVDAYGAMWEAGLRHPEGSVGPADGDIRVSPRVNTSRTSSGQNLTRRGAKAESKRGGSGKDVVVNERALAERRRVDRKLRKLAREMEEFLRGGRQGAVETGRCSGCGRVCEKGWRHCPWDGLEIGGGGAAGGAGRVPA